MSQDKPVEACGRCSMSTVVDAVNVDRDEEPPSPFADEHIEVDESSMRRVSPVAWTRRVTSRLNDAVHRFAYGR
ncbi:MAG: hypothetical protein ABEJ90_01780 [Halobacterium sp.]